MSWETHYLKQYARICSSPIKCPEVMKNVQLSSGKANHLPIFIDQLHFPKLPIALN